MALADRNDVQAHLPPDKLPVQPGNQEIAKADIDTERLIKGVLSAHFLPTTLATWADPDSTPEYIRAIAGRLTAAFYYRLRYAEDQRDDPNYAQFKYDEAMRMLQMVVDGTVILEEVQDLEPFTTELRFWPDDSTEPYFTMDREFT